MPLTRFLKIAILFLFVLAVSVPQVMGQAETATISGRVVDASGAVLVGAAVELRSVERGTVTTLTTNDAGIYVFASVQPGTYQLTVRKTGFRQTDLLGLIVNVQAHIEQNFRLEVGSVSESITVEGGAPVINLADSALGEVIVGRQVTELPLNGRNFTQLATLVPGVTRGVPTGSATGSGGNAETFRYGQAGGASLAVNGLRPQNNNFTLDGIDNNEALVNTIVFFPPADVIEEFRVQTSVAPAEIGRAGGAVVTTSTKAGTNDWHGTVFWFNRNTNLNARDFFNNGPTPAFNRNQFGATLGGPILKNKLFIFGDVQFLRLRQPAGSETATVPTDLMRTGDFSELLAGAGPVSNPTGLSAPITILDPTTGLQFMGNGAQPNVIPANRINSVGLAYLNAFPEPNCNATIDSRCHSIYQNYRNTRNIRENWNDFDVRGDYIFNSTNSFFLRVSRGRADQTNSTRLATLPSGWGSGTNFNHPYGAAIGWTDSIRSTLINEVRIGFVRTFYGYAPPFNNVNVCTQLGIVNCNTPLLGGIALIGGWNNQIEYTGDYGSYFIPQTGYQASDSLSWIRGNHTIKFGASVLRRQLNLYRPLAGKGYFFLSGNGNSGNHVNTGYEVSDLLAGFVDRYDHGTNYGMVGTRTWENGFFAQDDWKVTRRLTLNLGLRYDVYTWPMEIRNRQANFDLSTGALVVAGSNGSLRTAIPNNYHNFAPRLGFAYQLTDDGKTVLRGGFGIFYFMDRGGIDNQLAQNPPFSGENSASYTDGYRITLSGALPCQPTCTAAQLLSTQATAPLPSGNFTNLNLSAPTNVGVIALLPTNVVPNVSQWNLQVQRKIDSNSSASIAYVGTHGAHLTRNYNANQPSFGVPLSSPLSKAFPQLGTVKVQDNSGKSDYNSLQAQYERRLSNGWQFLGAFTWSKALDDACGNLDSCAPQLFTNYAAERGLSNIDQNYRLVLSSLYELPFGRGKRWGHDWSRPLDWALGGWQMNGIYTLQSGLPFTVNIDGNPGTWPSAVRPDLVGAPSVNPGNLNNYINAAAFAAPPSTGGVYDRPGTAGRDILRGPGSSNLDFALFKNLAFTERFKAQFRAQAYNLSNTPHFGNPNSNFSWGNFGQISGTVPFTYRQVELGLRIIF
ncbi:MAG: TonB-dependent receptor [Acidobacteriia bacterium]|nr:TonB-dependent receptor [Terriglobia bacterium]